MSAPAVGAIIVAYHPEQSALQTLVQAIAPQVQTVVVVDNTPKESRAAWMNEVCTRMGLVYLGIGANIGIAAAQNRGIDYLLQQGVDFILFLDHDSIPANNMVSELLNAYHQHQHHAKPIAAVGPFSFIPKLKMHIPFMTMSGQWYEKQYCDLEHHAFWVNHLISSGSLVPRAAIEAIGMMDESLFIDYVDIEWCLRAQARGYALLGTCRATMQHDLGDEPLQLFGQQFLTHSPTRHYYLVRNAILLYKKDYIPWRWKYNDALRVSAKIMLYCFFLAPRWQHFRMACKGFIDGLKGHSGSVSP